MSNWKERAEVELARQKEQVVTDTSDKEKEIRYDSFSSPADQQLYSFEKDKFAEFDQLEVIRKFEAITREVLNGSGEVSTDIIHNDEPDFFNYVLDGVRAKKVSLCYLGLSTAEIAIIIKEKFVTKTGRYSEYPNAGTNQSGEYYLGREVRRFGKHQESVGYLIAGATPTEAHPMHPLSVRYEFSYSKDNTGKDCRIKEQRLIIEDYFSETDFRKAEIFPLSSSVNINPQSIAVDMSWMKFEQMSPLIDAALLQSCVARLPYIRDWEEDTKSAQAKVKKINSRIGEFSKDYKIWEMEESARRKY